MKELIQKAKSIVDKDIVTITVEYIDFDGNEKSGDLEVHKDVQNEVKSIFNEIKDLQFPIFQIKTIDNYNYDDEESVKANNSSAYNFRFVSNTTKLSDHAIGLAIDINPVQNPWIHPSALNLFPYNIDAKGTIIDNDEVVNIFKKYGWSWGGYWRNPDYQHFFKSGTVNNNIKNKLYNLLGIENPYLKTKGKVDRFKDFVKKIIR